MSTTPRFPWLAALLAALGFSATATAQAQVAVGDMAPDFRLQDQDGQWRTLAQYRGQYVALYFYPKDQTPGCTKEACSFRDSSMAFEAVGAAILGVSLDDVKSHEEFAKKYSLPFPLLADVDGSVAKRYGVLRELLVMKFARRETFLVDPDGRIVKHYQNVDPATHTAEVLADIKAL
jgi:peroxiredoxin Q/BCP